MKKTKRETMRKSKKKKTMIAEKYICLGGTKEIYYNGR